MYQTMLFNLSNLLFKNVIFQQIHPLIFGTFDEKFVENMFDGKFLMKFVIYMVNF